MALQSLLLIELFLLLLPLSTSAAGNILLTGDILPAGNHLSSRNAAFFIHKNCSLSLHHSGRLRRLFHSASPASSCALTLSPRGQLLFQAPDGRAVWSSSSPSQIDGQYAAILRPDGHLAVYGPSIWSTPPRRWSADRSASIMFSNQVLAENSKLGGLAVRADCALQLASDSEEGVVWEGGGKGGGNCCFLRLDSRGQLALVDRRFEVVWASEPAEEDGFYVLFVMNRGQAAVFGPEVWSTAHDGSFSF